MQFTFAAIATMLATAVVAAPNRPDLSPKLKWTDKDCVAEEKDTDCLTDDKAKAIIDTYETLISRSVTGAEFNATVDAILDAEFFTMSNGINAEVGKELEEISIPSPMAFKAAFHAAPPTEGTETLDMFHSCNKIAWRWLGSSPEGLPVRGLTMMNVTSEGKIADTFVEYFRPALINCEV